MERGAAAAEPWARRAFAALRRPAFRAFLGGHLASVLAFWMRLAAQGWLVYDLTGSEAMLGIVTAAGLLPTVFVSPWAGVWAEHADKRRLLMGVALGMVLANAALGALILVDVVRVAHVMATAVVVGTLRAVEMPVRQSYVVEVVGRDVLGNALALQASTFNLARVLGPTFAGLVVAGFGMGPCYLVVGALAATALVTLSRLPPPLPRRPVARHGPWTQLVEGLRYVAGQPRIRVQMLLMGGSMVLAWTYTGMLPALCRDAYGLGERGYGALMSVSGAGALAGALWVSGRAGLSDPSPRMLATCVGVGSLAVTALALAPTAWTAVVPLALAAGLQVAFMASSNTVIQAEVPDGLRGRVMGLWVFVFGASAPLGNLLTGCLAERFGIRPALAATSLLAAALAAALLGRLHRTTRRASGAAPPAPGSPA